MTGLTAQEWAERCRQIGFRNMVDRLPQERVSEARYLARRLDSLGDRVGGNNFALSGVLWAAAASIEKRLRVIKGER
jgi:hypothetical protein